MPRKDFGSMLGTIDKAATPEPAPLAVVEAPAAPATAPAKKKPAAQQAPRSRKQARPTKAESTAGPAAAAGGVGYDKLERKDTRLHERQIADLTDLTRRLNRERNGEGHRLTENTLIRLAIDLLLQRSDDLKGTTEIELAASLGLH